MARPATERIVGEGAVPAIVSAERWQGAQARRDPKAVVAAMLNALLDVRAILTRGEPKQRKMAVRRFLAGIRMERRRGRPS